MTISILKARAQLVDKLQQVCQLGVHLGIDSQSYNQFSHIINILVSATTRKELEGIKSYLESPARWRPLLINEVPKKLYDTFVGEINEVFPELGILLPATPPRVIHKNKFYVLLDNAKRLLVDPVDFGQFQTIVTTLISSPTRHDLQRIKKHIESPLFWKHSLEDPVMKRLYDSLIKEIHVQFPEAEIFLPIIITPADQDEYTLRSSISSSYFRIHERNKTEFYTHRETSAATTLSLKHVIEDVRRLHPKYVTELNGVLNLGGHLKQVRALADVFKRIAKRDPDIIVVENTKELNNFANYRIKDLLLRELHVSELTSSLAAKPAVNFAILRQQRIMRDYYLSKQQESKREESEIAIAEKFKEDFASKMDEILKRDLGLPWVYLSNRLEYIAKVITDPKAEAMAVEYINHNFKKQAVNSREVSDIDTVHDIAKKIDWLCEEKTFIPEKSPSANFTQAIALFRNRAHALAIKEASVGRDKMHMSDEFRRFKEEYKRLLKIAALEEELIPIYQDIMDPQHSLIFNRPQAQRMRALIDNSYDDLINRAHHNNVYPFNHFTRLESAFPPFKKQYKQAKKNLEEKKSLKNKIFPTFSGGAKYSKEIAQIQTVGLFSRRHTQSLAAEINVPARQPVIALNQAIAALDNYANTGFFFCWRHHRATATSMMVMLKNIRANNCDDVTKLKQARNYVTSVENMLIAAGKINVKKYSTFLTVLNHMRDNFLVVPEGEHQQQVVKRSSR